MKTTQVGKIIHIFALLHAVVAFTCRHVGVEDELLLTILTMVMTLLICIRKGSNVEFTAACIIVVNIFGYFLGVSTGILLEKFIDSQPIVSALATTITTELLGWGIVTLTKFLGQPNTSATYVPSNHYKWIISAAIAVFSIRIGIMALTSSKLFDSTNMLDITSQVVSNSFALITLICINIIYIRYAGRIGADKSKAFNVIMLILFSLVSALITTTVCSIGPELDLVISSWLEFIQIYIIAIIAQITIYCLVYMCNYAITTGNRIRVEKEKKHIAQYRYQKLKRQVNPHFLFNSLNVLDCMVWDSSPEQASTYIHKLAGVYRYMIKSEEEEVVTLREELTFVEMYVDLLKVRFPKGFEVILDIKEEDQARYVLPCSIQLLIENATKHNAVSEDNPLIVRVESDGQQIRVWNNIIPKITKVASTGLGQKYIRQQYRDLSGKEILIQNTETEYCVTMPLL